MKIDKIYYWNKDLNTYLPCVWNETFECYTPDLYKKIELSIVTDIFLFQNKLQVTFPYSTVSLGVVNESPTARNYIVQNIT